MVLLEAISQKTLTKVKLLQKKKNVSTTLLVNNSF